MIRVLLALTILTAGCQTAPSPEAPAEPTSPAVAEPAPPEAVTEVGLVLDIDGLRFIRGASAQPVPFGTDLESTVEMVSALRGEPAERGTHEECGAGPLAFASWNDGLTLWGMDGEFQGWAVGAEDEAGTYTTMTGLGIGSTQADLDGAYTAVIEETTLGREFYVGEEEAEIAGLSGLLNDEGSDGPIVTSMWAGVSCNFR